MIEAVGHEFMDKFFSCCEDALAENGIFVLQVTLTSSSRFPHRCKTIDLFNVLTLL